MQRGQITTADLLTYFQVPGEAGSPPESIYVLGSFEQRVTLYAQQVRALNLAHALFEERRLVAGASVAVIGGGVAGVTASVALACLGAKVHLFERADVMLPLQKGCRTRWIHPHIYDWPEPESEGPEGAALPALVRWQAGYAHDVAEVLEGALDRAGAAVRKILSAKVWEIVGGARPALSWHGTSPAGTRDDETGRAFDALIVAVGFGLERGTSELPMSSYWRVDDLEQPLLRTDHEPVPYLVSGNGDGGVIDVLRLRLRRFRLEDLHTYLGDLFDAPDLEKLKAQLRAWEREAAAMTREAADAWLWQRYKDIEIAPDKEVVLRRHLRRDTKVWLAAARSPITVRSAILNRLWVALLVKYDPDRLFWIQSATHAVSGSTATFERPVAARQTVRPDQTFARAIIRHGPGGALEGSLDWIGQRCAPMRARNPADDKSRWPIWPDGRFEADTRPPPAMPRPMPVPESVLMPAPVPESVLESPTPAGFESSSGTDASRDAGTVIEFEAHCRVSADSVRAAVECGSQTPPVLRWHPTIARALVLVQKYAEQIDTSIRDGSPSVGERSEVPVFKASFFEAYDKLAPTQEALGTSFAQLWRFLANADRDERVAAVQTFAGFAALRMVMRLRAFEGLVRADDGRVIVNLFPDLPPNRSSWLVRMVPYRSDVGALAFGESQFLLCRIGPTDGGYEYFVLPRSVAERWQDDGNGLPKGDVQRWIVPQWFFHGYADEPVGPAIVWGMSDDYGRECRREQRAPWRNATPIDESPHPSVGVGDLRELATDWSVLVAPDDPLVGGVRVDPPMASRHILWVDDRPKNNMFEVGYLEQMGARVSRATTTAQAVELIEADRPDLIISDIARVEHGQRNGRAGVDLMHRVTPMNIPIVFYTGNRARAPVEIRDRSADHGPALFALVRSALSPAR